MNTEIMLELGRVVYVNYGPDAGKIGVVVDIVNAKKVVIDGPSLGLIRKAISTRRVELTPFKVPGVKTEDSTGTLKTKIEKFDLLKRFQSSGLGKKVEKQKKRASLTDFDRFKVMVTKRKLSRVIRSHLNKNRKKLTA